MIGHAVRLALQYLRAHPVRTAVLVLGLTVALALPAFTVLAARRVEGTLLSRAVATPIVIGHKGNEFDLTMSALYFRGRVREGVPAGVAEAVRDQGYGVAVPLHTGHSAGGAPLVGTSLDYFDARGLVLAQGRRPALLGEVVAGSEVAYRARLGLGDHVRSDLDNLYNIAGSYPLVLTVVGVLDPTGTPDDEAWFTDVKTTWAIDGYLHGHEAVTQDNALAPASEDENLEATAALFMVHELTDQNRATFHLHGDQGELPVSAVLVFPSDDKAHDQVLGDLALSERDQAVRPVQVVRTILGIVLRVRDGLIAYFGLVAASTVAFLALILSLSLRLREDELRLVRRLGAARGTVTAMVTAEVAIVLLLAATLSAALTASGLAVVASWL